MVFEESLCLRFLVEEKSEKIASGEKGKEIWGDESGAQAPGGGSSLGAEPAEGKTH